MKASSIKYMVLGMLGCTSATDINAELPPQEETKDQPNVLFIIMDDMCDWAHYLGGNNQVITPNLDRLAARGVTFSNAYATVPFSNPSRSSMLTGLTPMTTGIYQNNHEMQASPEAMASVMMPEHFHNNGYHTLWSGKIFHNRPDEKRLANMWDDRKTSDGGYGPWMKYSERPAKGTDWKGYEAWDGPDTDFPDIVNSQYVIDFFGKKHKKPFFVAMGLYRPHAPYVVPKRFFDMYNPNDIQLPEVPEDDIDDLPQYALNTFYQQVCSVRGLLPEWRENGTWKRIVHAYLASITFSDYVIGNILDALDKSPYADNTIIVLVGDNGFHMGQKERFSKLSLWRESCHVPMIIAAPESVSAKVDTPVSLLDVYPTLVSMCDLPKISALEGNDLKPLVTNPSMDWDKPCISNYIRGNYTVHYKNWNYIHYQDGSGELYNIAEDENEFDNLYQKEEYKGLIKQLQKYVPAKSRKPVAQMELKKKQRIAYPVK